MSSLTFSDRQAIIALCKAHETPTIRVKPDFRKCMVFKSYFVKYGNPYHLKLRGKTQDFFHSLTVDDPSAPRIPKVVDYFTVRRETAYLVMEFVDGTTPTEIAYKQVADALQWLRDVPPPAGAKIGSVGGGRARQEVFKDFEAPLLFTSNEALHKYMNEALLLIPGQPKPAKISFSNEKLVFTQSDMKKSNFLLDKDGKIWIVDVENVTLLPASFASYTMHVSHVPFVQGAAGHLEWPPLPNEVSMKFARSMLAIMADPTLGLDPNGLPVASIKASRW